jgi:hypothetical protein
VLHTSARTCVMCCTRTLVLQQVQHHLLSVWIQHSLSARWAYYFTFKNSSLRNHRFLLMLVVDLAIVLCSVLVAIIIKNVIFEHWQY